MKEDGEVFKSSFHSPEVERLEFRIFCYMEEIMSAAEIKCLTYCILSFVNKFWKTAIVSFTHSTSMQIAHEIGETRTRYYKVVNEEGELSKSCLNFGELIWISDI